MFAGLLSDLNGRLPYYVSDFTDAAHRKVLSSAFYLFFACLANAIAFGALSSVLTNGEIGTIEMLIATVIGGIVYALFSAQPITLLGGTGPIVIFTALLYQASDLLGVSFMGVYAWVGIWSGVFLLILSVTNASNWMRFFSRFTDDIFAALVSIIFIVEAVANLSVVLREPEQSPDVRALVVTLATGTLLIALFFNRAGSASRFQGTIFGKVSDFGPSIAIVAMGALAYALADIPVQGPVLPQSFETTTSGRPWLIPILDVPLWVILVTTFPAAFASVLLYLDQNITSRIINESGANLRKGRGYHLDLLLIGLLVLGFSFFGMPWIVAATVHSVNHLKGLSGMRSGRDGVKSYVIENRVSALAIHILIAGSIFLLDYVALIPLPVLLGLFVYMGYVSLRGNDFANRVMATLMSWMLRRPVGPAPVKLRTVHRYTVCQAGAFALLWVVKSSAIGILFPIFIALCVPFRILLGRWFSGEDLATLDDYDPTRPL